MHYKKRCTIYAKTAEQQQDFSFLESRLDLFLKEYKAKNYFQLLGLSETAKSLEINKSFAELDSYFNPRKLPENCPPGVVVKATSTCPRPSAKPPTTGIRTPKVRPLGLVADPGALARSARQGSPAR